MGTSTDGMFFYGFLIPENHPYEFGPYEWEDYLDAKMGWDLLPYMEKHEKREALLKELDVQIHIHCSGSYPMMYVAVESARKSNRRGYAEKVDFLVPDETDEGFTKRTLLESHKAKIKKFCEVMKIKEPTPEELGWWVASYWSD